MIPLPRIFVRTSNTGLYRVTVNPFKGVTDFRYVGKIPLPLDHTQEGVARYF